jgi:hypothetical protein
MNRYFCNEFNVPHCLFHFMLILTYLTSQPFLFYVDFKIRLFKYFDLKI